MSEPFEAARGELGPECVSDLSLDRLLQGELSPTRRQEVEAHVHGCLRCQGVLAEMKQAALAFAQSGEAPLLAARTKRRASAVGGGPLVRWVAPVAAIAAALTLVVVLARPSRPADLDSPSSDERPKGGDVLSVLVKRGRDGAVAPLSPGGEASPGDRLRFSLDLHQPAFVRVLSLDGRPMVNDFQSTAVRLEAGRAQLLDLTVELDEVLGPERFVAVLCDHEPGAELLASARRALQQAGGRPEQVTSIDSGCRETSVLVLKVEK